MKNFEKMSTKKLNALLNSANDEDRAAIVAELQNRGVSGLTEQAEPAQAEPAQAEPAQAEQAEPEQAEPAQAEQAKGKMSEEERAALIEELRANVVGHRCEVLPMGCPEWVNGTVTGIMNDKRATNILLTIKTDDGRTVRKMHNAATLRVSKETVELTHTRAGRVAGPKDETPWDTLEADILAAGAHVGKLVTFSEFNQTEEANGRITGVVPDKRVKKLLYRIVTEAGKTVHKVTTAPMAIAPDFDEAGAKMNAEFVERRERIANKEPKTLEQKIAQAELDLQKSQERLISLQATIEAKTAALAALKAEAEVAAQTAAQAEPEAAAQVEPEIDELA